MTDSSTDAEALACHARALGRELAAAIPAWIERAVRSRVRDDDFDAGLSEAVATAGAEARETIEPQLQELLALDIDDQRTTPLQVARGAVPFATEILHRAGVAPVDRDDNAQSLHPEDVYDITPGGFADFGDGVQEAGILWGAAKAYVHLNRHKPPPRPVGAVVPNLMDRSRFPSDVTFLDAAEVPGPGDLRLLVVDLDRVEDLAGFVADDRPTIGYCAHVDEARMATALESGFSEVMPRSVFFRRLSEIVSAGDHSTGTES